MTQTVPAATDNRRDAYIAGLRALADLLEAQPDLVLPFDGRTLGLSVVCSTNDDQRTQLAAWARALPGKKTKRETGRGGELLKLSGTLHGLKIDILADRDEVCERIVVGTREVVETVPDPELLAAVPIVEVTRTVEDIEWRCTPVLGAATVDGA